MIEIIFRAWLTLLAQPDRQAEAFESWDPHDLTVEKARTHLDAAQQAAEITGQDPYLLLYIAWHESRFFPGARTAEPGGKTSCGAMTPIPKYHCRVGSLSDQYLEGAKHLQTWSDACAGDARCQLLGYAGGFVLIRACRGRDRLWRWHGRRRVNVCGTADLYINGSADLREHIERHASF